MKLRFYCQACSLIVVLQQKFLQFLETATNFDRYYAKRGTEKKFTLPIPKRTCIRMDGNP